MQQFSRAKKMKIQSAFIQSLSWRSALKSFVPIAPSLVNVQPILEATRLAPSAFGAQPYDIHVVTDPDLKLKLREVSYDQAQVTECSHLLVFCARNDASESVERFIKWCEVEEKAPTYATALRSNVSPMPTEQFLSWSTNQAYIALGVACSAAADARIGSCPMSGFVPKDVHRVLDLPSNQWPVAYLAIGSHLDNNEDPNRLKFRLPTDSLFTFHNAQTETAITETAIPETNGSSS